MQARLYVLVYEKGVKWLIHEATDKSAAVPISEPSSNSWFSRVEPVGFKLLTHNPRNSETHADIQTNGEIKNKNA